MERAAASGAVAMDWRDVLVALVPFYDCALRLDLDPVGLFDGESTDAPQDLQDVVRQFARRSDITLDAFGWTLTMTPNGLCYEPA
jgi:hypothetical protein